MKKDKVLNAIRSVREGKLTDYRFGSRMLGQGSIAEQIARMFHVACRRHGFGDVPELSTAAFRRPAGAQLAMGF